MTKQQREVWLSATGQRLSENNRRLWGQNLSVKVKRIADDNRLKADLGKLFTPDAGKRLLVSTLPNIRDRFLVFGGEPTMEEAMAAILCSARSTT